MAFNPFHWFRKHTKVLMAALAIMCMLLFVLGSGVKGGDINDYLERWFGWKMRGNTTEVAKLYGQKQTVNNLIELRSHRQIANEFMRAAWERKIEAFANISLRMESRNPLERLFRVLEALRVAATKDKLDKIEDKFKERHDTATREVGMGMVQMASLTTQSDDLGRENLRHGLRALAQIRDDLTKDNKNEAAEAVATEIQILDYLAWEEFGQSGGMSQSYFGGGVKLDELLDFDLWLHQADRLGIRFTNDDIRRLVENDCPLKSLLSGNDAKDELEYYRLVPSAKNAKAALPDLYQALGDEFRVRLAQASLLGVAPGARSFHPGTGLAGQQIPNWPTPDEFFQYYRDNLTSVRVTILALPVKDFLDKVKETPTKEELLALYNRYKEIETTPEREKPGFKEPRRVAVEWVQPDPESAYYQKKSAELTPIVEGITKWFPGFGSASPNVGTAVASLAVASVPADELGIQAEYEKYLKELLDKRILSSKDNRSLFDPNSEIMARGPHRSENVAAFVGQFLLGSCATPDGVAASANAVAAEMGVTTFLNKPLAPRLAGLVAAGFDPTMFAALTQQAALVYIPPERLPDARKYLLARAQQQYATTLAEGEMAEFKKKLDEVRSDPKAAAEFVKTNAVPDKGFTLHRLEEPLDQREMLTSPVSSLRQAYEKEWLEIVGRSGRQDFPRFEELLFGTNRQLYHPETLPALTMFSRLPEMFRERRFLAMMGIQGDPSLLLFWKTQDRSAYVPSFDEARPKVEAAWRFQKARELARKEADTLAKDVREHTGAGGGAVYLRDLAAARGFRWFDAPDAIARLTTPPRATPSHEPVAYEPYSLPESVVSLARSDTPEQLVRDLQKPEDATVFRDRPDKNYYVAALMSRIEPTMVQFRSVYQAAVPDGGLFSGRDLLLLRLEREREREYRKNLLKQLRTEAQAPLDEFGNYRIDPDVRDLIEGRNRGEQ